jgi:hypothetical protein
MILNLMKKLYDLLKVQPAEIPGEILLMHLF